MRNCKLRMVLCVLFACLIGCLSAQEPTENQAPSNKVTSQERFEREIESIKEEVVARVENTFSEYDTNDDEKLSWDEYREIYLLRAEELKKSIEQLEAQNLEVPEELIIRLRRAESDNPGIPEENERREEFTLMDTDEDEHLTAEELTNYRIEQIDKRLQMRLQQELDAKDSETEEVREE
ncbi:MAG: hypothetical protein F4039_10820 [Gammaproteobacteria bacterium]|nr:hypothetical protein [Gammaproteobacteria bacterium]MYK44558.1 hypothetical protein [Gammaproteobacteria bacterium]